MADKKISDVSGNEAQPEDKVPQAVLVCGVDIDESTALKVKNPLVNIGISRFMREFDRQLRKLDSRMVIRQEMTGFYGVCAVMSLFILE